VLHHGGDCSLFPLVDHLFSQSKIEIITSSPEVFQKYDGLYNIRQMKSDDMKQLAATHDFDEYAVISDLMIEQTLRSDGRDYTNAGVDDNIHQWLFLVDHAKYLRPFVVSSILPPFRLEDGMLSIPLLQEMEIDAYLSPKRHSGEMIAWHIKGESHEGYSAVQRCVSIADQVNNLRQQVFMAQMAVPVGLLQRQIANLDHPWFEVVKDVRSRIGYKKPKTPSFLAEGSDTVSAFRKRITNVSRDLVKSPSVQALVPDFVADTMKQVELAKERHHQLKHNPAVSSYPRPDRDSGKVSVSNSLEMRDIVRKSDTIALTKEVASKGRSTAPSGPQFIASGNPRGVTLNYLMHNQVQRYSEAEAVDALLLFGSRNSEYVKMMRDFLHAKGTATFSEIFSYLVSQMAGQDGYPREAEALYALYVGRSQCKINQARFTLNDVTKLEMKVEARAQQAAQFDFVE